MNNSIIPVSIQNLALFLVLALLLKHNPNKSLASICNVCRMLKYLQRVNVIFKVCVTQHSKLTNPSANTWHLSRQMNGADVNISALTTLILMSSYSRYAPDGVNYYNGYICSGPSATTMLTNRLLWEVGNPLVFNCYPRYIFSQRCNPWQ